jgi:hypothetical protein
MGPVRTSTSASCQIGVNHIESPMLEDILPKELFDTVYKAANDPYFPPPDPGVLPTWNGATGEHLKDVPLLRMYRVSRRRMRTHCAQGIDVQVGTMINF